MGWNVCLHLVEPFSIWGRRWSTTTTYLLLCVAASANDTSSWIIFNSHTLWGQYEGSTLLRPQSHEEPSTGISWSWRSNMLFLEDCQWTSINLRSLLPGFLIHNVLTGLTSGSSYNQICRSLPPATSPSGGNPVSLSPSRIMLLENKDCIYSRVRDLELRALPLPPNTEALLLETRLDDFFIEWQSHSQLPGHKEYQDRVRLEWSLAFHLTQKSLTFGMRSSPTELQQVGDQLLLKGAIHSVTGVLQLTASCFKWERGPTTGHRALSPQHTSGCTALPGPLSKYPYGEWTLSIDLQHAYFHMTMPLSVLQVEGQVIPVYLPPFRIGYILWFCHVTSPSPGYKITCLLWQIWARSSAQAKQHAHIVLRCSSISVGPSTTIQKVGIGSPTIITLHQHSVPRCDPKFRQPWSIEEAVPPFWTGTSISCWHSYLHGDAGPQG